MTLYQCLCNGGGAYLFTEPDGDNNQPIALEEQAGEMLVHLPGLQSFVAAQALASLCLWGLQRAIGQRGFGDSVLAVGLRLRACEIMQLLRS